MLTPLSGRPQELRVLIADFLSERRDEKPAKAGPDDPPGAKLNEKFRYVAWIDDAAQRVSRLQAATHTLKPMHKDAKGTSVKRPPSTLTQRAEVGTHCLDDDFALDVVGNAAYLDVYKFLKLTHQGMTLLDLMLARDPDLVLALSTDPEQANTWIDAFTGIIEPRGKVASHTLAKQVYWLVGNNPLNADHYYLLAPLYASSLAHHVFQTVKHRFSEVAKAARQARQDEVFTDQVIYKYLQMAVQKLGGTKPQNISQLNSERGGNNYLLASLPPIWKSSGVQPLLRTESMFQRYEARLEVSRTLKALRAFFESREFLRPGFATKQENDTVRDDLVSALIDEFIQFTAELHMLAPGWSQSPECKLRPVEKRWLDPAGEEGISNADDDFAVPWAADSADEVGKSFARWLNDELLNKKLPVGDAEYLYWRALFSEQLRDNHLEVKP